MRQVKYDEQLIDQLNKEYTNKPIVPAPLGVKKEDRLERAKREAANLARLVSLKGQTILEIGCGEGDLSCELAKNYDAKVTGIDVRDMEGWNELNHPNLTLMKYDLTTEKMKWAENSFTRIISNVVWEHIRHPYTALRRCQKLLHPKGKMYIYANLYRSAKSSHLYHDLFFPWPQLLFSPETIFSWLNVKQQLRRWAFWVNKLTYAQYLLYFRKLGFYITFEKLIKSSIDEEFYKQFQDKLGLYPRFDLELDFFEVILEFDLTNPKSPVPDPIYHL
jgi:2-polyprenyl-3-methyl-5-hydroxy-6-metoxy-1,4-benzoquinol methylase